MLTLEAISESELRPEHVLWRQFNLVRPRILGGLLDAVVEGLRNQARARVRHMPRMADFAVWAAACETAFSPAGSFESAYWHNRRVTIEGVVDGDPTAACIREFVTGRQEDWSGTASELLCALEKIRHDLGKGR